MRKLKVPITRIEKGPMGIVQPVTYNEAEQELSPLEIQWKRWPVPESYVDKALDDWKLSVKKQLRENGLMR